VLVRCHILVAKEDDLMVEQSLAKFADHVVTEIVGHIDPVNDTTAGTRETFYFEFGHILSLL
jgi:hypothetical protein